ncbi:MAG TPA: tRNA (adenosine(37)-N6)-threonylcarbamoyltransferase complex transferase subunit TsaD [Syntrophomonadaceae bacterium]|nr:tRNA (adenosine(37)-N6)-threonylcarbamoyltransferase complex transferase subunit TsaD [Syntrophomonadaceae bacterium]
MTINILGIETSCDETAAAVVQNGRHIMSNVVNSQIDIHRQFGGVVPEVASRKHVENIGLVVEQAISDSGLSYADLDAVAVTNRPGLIGALLVGLSFAKAFAYGIDKPLITVNHLYGHIYANLLEHPHMEFPAICLVVSGGHTSLLLMHSDSEYDLIGETLDDAAGEAFDKVARFLGLGYPGGPAIQKAAASGQPGRYSLPRVFLNRSDLEFSFSGLKTAVMNEWRKAQQRGEADVNDMAAEFQYALVEVLVGKTMQAAEQNNARSVIMAGGVAANSLLRELMTQRGRELGKPVYYPSLSLCTDNAAMIAAAAYPLFIQGRFAPLNANAQASL